MRQASMAEPEEGTGQAGPPSGCSSSFIRAFGPIDRDRRGPPEAVPIEMLVVDLLQDLSVLRLLAGEDTPQTTDNSPNHR
jgi:hypothetical protein